MFKNKDYRGTITLVFFALGITTGLYGYTGLAIFFGLCIAGSDISEAINGLMVQARKAVQ